MAKGTRCNDTRPCFAKISGQKNWCRILTETYEDGKCVFCKKEREVTNGKRYRLNRRYVG